MATKDKNSHPQSVEPRAFDMTRDEFRDVYRVFRPTATREEFGAEWDEFQKYKREVLAKRSVQW